MTKCKTCSADVSTSAETCPSCGAKLKRKMGCLGKVLVTGLIFFVLAIGAIMAMDTGNQQQEAQVAALAVSDLAFEALDVIYNLESTYTDLQKEEEWKNYEGKKVKWTGEVSSIDEMFGTMTLQVKMKPDTFTSDLLIRLKESEREKALQFKEGDSVTFIGVLSEWGTLLPITLSEGEIVSN